MLSRVLYLGLSLCGWIRHFPNDVSSISLCFIFIVQHTMILVSSHLASWGLGFDCCFKPDNVSAATKSLGDFPKGVSIATLTRRTMLLCFAGNKEKKWTRQCNFAAEADSTYYYSSISSFDQRKPATLKATQAYHAHTYPSVSPILSISLPFQII